MRVDHTAIAVRDLEEATERYRRIYGVEPGETLKVPNQSIEVVFLPIGDTQLELISPTSSDTGVARFLERQGEKVHHIGVLVDDIGAELTRLRSQGIELIDETPKPGAHGLIAFVHPRSTGGVLLELVQHSDPVALS